MNITNVLEEPREMTDREKLMLACGFIQGLSFKLFSQDQEVARDFIKMLNVFPEKTEGEQT